MCRTLSNNSDAIAERKEGEKKRGSFRKPNKIGKKKRKNRKTWGSFRTKNNSKQKVARQKRNITIRNMGIIQDKTHMWVWN